MRSSHQETITKCGAENFSVPALVNNQLTGYGVACPEVSLRSRKNAAGNMISDPTDGFTVTYDAGNMLKTVGPITYWYDNDGQRYIKWNNGIPVKSYFYGAGGEILAEGSGGSTLTAEYIFFNGKRIARVDLPGNTVHYYLSDHLGSTSMVVNSAGAIEEESDFSPFGTEYIATGPGANTYKFSGKERDSESGLDYFGARYYSNGLGRFITPDWAAKAVDVPYAEFSDPQSLNLYSYVRNIPTTRLDVDGHSDYLWQKTKNLVSGNGWKTDAQVKGWSVAKTAQNHVGSNDWAIKGNNSSGKDVGHPQDFHSGQDKCNQFVGDTLAEAGKARPEITVDGKTRMPDAHELADSNVKIPGLSDPKPLSQAQPGDVIAQEHGDTYGHAGIVVMGSDGKLATVSANATGSYGGQITQNNWGFRPAGQNGESATDPAPVVRTPQ